LAGEKIKFFELARQAVEWEIAEPSVPVRELPGGRGIVLKLRRDSMRTPRRLCASTIYVAKQSHYPFYCGEGMSRFFGRDPKKGFPGQSSGLRERMRAVERRDWWLWSCAVLMTLLLTLAVISFALPVLHARWPAFNAAPIGDTVLGLVALVLLFDIYTVYQHFQVQQVRKQLIAREELFRLITENAADMIAVVSASGDRLYNSPSYEKILGYTPSEIEATAGIEQIHPDDREKVQKVAAEARRTGIGQSVEYRMRHKNGNWLVLESMASTIIDDRGLVEKLVIVNRDITHRKQLEEQFRQVQKMEAVGRLSGGVAHDFNNLLGVIIGYGEIVQEGLDTIHPLRGSVDEILKAGHRAASLTRQLLAFSRQQVLDPKVLDLNAVVKDMEKMLKRLIGEDVELRTELENALVRVKADESQIEQVILNLAINARDAMPHGGKLALATSNFHMDENFVRRYPFPVNVGNYILLKVSDTGSGMDPRTKARIFEPFFTTKEKGKGTGLGLSMVYGIVKQSNGYIDVSSELGVGTTFDIYLPKVDEAVDISTSTATSASLRGSETILVVEDDPSLRVLAVHILESCGYSVLEASSGAAALEISRQQKFSIHLLLTDVVMPGMSGRVLAEQIVAQSPHIVVLYMSGYTGQTVGAHGVLAEGSYFLPKPFTRDALARKIREVLDRGMAASAN
jgi:two-component system, cell cycle sensor histidine kinase and response regulator CckA